MLGRDIDNWPFGTDPQPPMIAGTDKWRKVGTRKAYDLGEVVSLRPSRLWPWKPGEDGLGISGGVIVSQKGLERMPCYDFCSVEMAGWTGKRAVKREVFLRGIWAGWTFSFLIGSEEDGSLNSLVFQPVIDAHKRDPFTCLLNPTLQQACSGDKVACTLMHMH